MIETRLVERGGLKSPKLRERRLANERRGKEN